MWPNLHLSILMRSHAKESFTQHAHRQLLLKSGSAGDEESDSSSPRESGSGRRSMTGSGGARRASDEEGARTSDATAEGGLILFYLPLHFVRILLTIRLAPLIFYST